MNLKEKKGYHVYLSMDVMKAFRKYCVDEAVPYSHALETLMLRELEDKGRLQGLTLEDLSCAAREFSPKVDAERCSGL